MHRSQNDDSMDLKMDMSTNDSTSIFFFFFTSHKTFHILRICERVKINFSRLDVSPPTLRLTLCEREGSNPSTYSSTALNIAYSVIAPANRYLESLCNYFEGNSRIEINDSHSNYTANSYKTFFS